MSFLSLLECGRICDLQQQRRSEDNADLAFFIPVAMATERNGSAGSEQLRCYSSRPARCPRPGPSTAIVTVFFGVLDCGAVVLLLSASNIDSESACICHVQMVERAGRHNNATCVVPSRLAALPRDRPNVLRDIDGIEVSVAEV
jgi:hypothetical protein